MLPSFKTLLYATDLSAQSPKVFRYALSVAHQYGARIVLVHVVEPLGATGRALVDTYLSPEQRELLQDRGFEHLREVIHEKIIEFCGQEGCAVDEEEGRIREVRVVEGRPSQVILEEAARAEADLIVMGSHGHSAMGDLLLGTVAHRVLQRATMPVLTVRLDR